MQARIGLVDIAAGREKAAAMGGSGSVVATAIRIGTV
jgi:hypothetical protein